MYKLSISFLFITLVLNIGCGRINAPVPPEQLAPKPVQYTSVVTNKEDLTIEWLSPIEDVRGKELKKLDGFKVYRKTLPQKLSVLKEAEEDELEYELISVVMDTTSNVLAQKKELARASLRPIRTASLTNDERKVSFTDADLKPGQLYLYKVVGYNSVGFEGPALKFIEVLFDGQNSVVKRLNSEDDAGNIYNANVNSPEQQFVEEETETGGFSPF